MILVYPLELQKRSAFHIASNYVPNHHSMLICPYYNSMVITRATIIYVLINYWMPYLVCQAIQHINATLDSTLKSRDITLPTKVHLLQAMAFPVVTYGCESWTIKKVECQQIDAFELWCWRRLLRVHWTARRPNQSILKEISPEYSLEVLMLKLKL